jgi:hypothetical protein
MVNISNLILVPSCNIEYREEKVLHNIRNVSHKTRVIALVKRHIFLRGGGMHPVAL